MANSGFYENSVSKNSIQNDSGRHSLVFWLYIQTHEHAYQYIHLYMCVHTHAYTQTHTQTQIILFSVSILDVIGHVFYSQHFIYEVGFLNKAKIRVL